MECLPTENLKYGGKASPGWDIFMPNEVDSNANPDEG